MRIHMTEIDGSLFEIEATLDDSTFLNIGPNAYDLCVNQGIHIYKGGEWRPYELISNSTF